MLKYVLAVCLGLTFGFAAHHAVMVEEDLAEAQKGVFKLARDIDVLRDGAEALLARKTALEKDIGALMTPIHAEALRVWGEFGKVCMKQKFSDLATDVGCATEWYDAFKNGQPFPT